MFAALVAVVVASALKDVALGGTLPPGLNGVFHLVLGASALGAILIRAEIYHKAVAALGLLGLAAYIGALFGQLS